VLFLVAAFARAQSVTGEIRLQVHDPSGAALEASGSLQGLATAVRRSFRTDADGYYALTKLPMGIYRLQIARDGFAPQSIRVEVRSENPIEQIVTLGIAGVQTTVDVREEETLLNPEATSAAQHLGPDQLRYRSSAAPGRSVIDMVNVQPGWLLEANGSLHPRGAEYDVQYVINGIPLYDNRSPAFSQSLGVEEFDSMTVRTAGMPAEFGRKLGGVVEVNTDHDLVPGLHGQLSLQGGSFDQRGGFASLGYGRGRNTFGISGEGFLTERYLDPPVIENFTNRGSGGALSARFGRNWSESDSTRVYLSSRHSGFLVPNEFLQQEAGQRQDRNAGETMGQISHTHLLSPHALFSLRGMVRDTSARLWSNPLSTPILPAQDRGFRDGYVGGSFTVNHRDHEWKAGVDAIFTDVREDFSYRILHYEIDGVPIFDSGVPAAFDFRGRKTGYQQSGFLQDEWRKGPFTLNAGVRFDQYRLIEKETAWSPRVGAAYAVPQAGLTLRASYDRIFMPPAFENVLMASSNLVSTLGGGEFLPLKSARGNFVEAGFAKSLLGKLRLDGSWYLRRIDNFADDTLLFNTGVSFPIAFRRANIHGYEAKVEVPRWGPFSGFVSYSNMLATGHLPVAGGLVLGEDAAGVLVAQGAFPVTQDQRNTFRGRFRVQPHRKVWFAAGSSYNSGLPFELEGVTDLDFIARQYGPAILSKVNFERGRVRPGASFDLSAGFELYQSDRKSLRLQGDVFNVFDRLNVINFAGALSGTAVQPGRNFALRLNASF